MYKYKIVVEQTAQQDAEEYAAYLVEESQSTRTADKWLSELKASIENLSTMPRRFRVIDEQPHFPIELRQFIHYSHHVIYHIQDETQTVHILRIYHGRRDQLQPNTLPTIFD